jgi:hypothetical protein
MPWRENVRKTIQGVFIQIVRRDYWIVWFSILPELNMKNIDWQRLYAGTLTACCCTAGIDGHGQAFFYVGALQIGLSEGRIGSICIHSSSYSPFDDVSQNA